MEERDWAGALTTLDRLDARLARSGNGRSRAIVHLRRGHVLLRLDRAGEAVVAIRAGLAGIKPEDDSLAGERVQAYTNLGSALENAFDYPGALAEYTLALNEAKTPGDRATTLSAMVRVGSFVDPVQAVKRADEVMAFVAGFPNMEKSRSVLGRALLNAGRTEDARAELRKALSELGGLTLRANLADIAARSDLAIAAMLAGDKEDARKYLAYTGAGRLPGDGMVAPVHMDTPFCGGLANITPEDVVVVEFSLVETGEVLRATPVYASRPGPMIGEFARSVRDWSWMPEEAAKIPAFYRLLSRVELRCSNSLKRPPASQLLAEELDRWLVAVGSSPVSIAKRDIAATMNTLAKSEEGIARNDPRLLGLMLAVVEIDGSSSVAADYASRAITIAREAGATPLAMAHIAITTSVSDARRVRSATRYAELAASKLSPWMTDSIVTRDPRGLATIRLAMVDHYNILKRQEEAQGLLRELVAQEGLDVRDPLRVGALIRLANLYQQRGDPEAARSAYQLTGLSAQECALVDARPAMTRHGLSSIDFPPEAMAWGFEGWTMTEHDIDATGKPVNIRTKVAYPPFVFGDAARTGFAKARFTQSYRPEGGLGCSAQSHRISFLLP